LLQGVTWAAPCAVKEAFMSFGRIARSGFSVAFLSRAVLAVAAVQAFGVACQTPDTRPDAMGADKHREAAEVHRASAAEHEARYDPSATKVEVLGPPMAEPNIEIYNPTQSEHDAAERDLAEAKAHEKAAAQLETLEDEACAATPIAERDACPILGSVHAIVPIVGGARVQLTHKGSTLAVAAHLKCHAAFASKQGTPQIATCPLYVKGLTVEVDGDWIVMRSDSPGSADEIRRLLRGHLPHGPK
jgi:hypothetical protein